MCLWLTRGLLTRSFFNNQCLLVPDAHLARSPLQGDLEDEAAGLMGKGDLEGARSMLAHHTNDSAIAAVSSYHTLFDTLVARYHDGYQMEVSKSTGRAERKKKMRWLLADKTNEREEDCRLPVVLMGKGVASPRWRFTTEG